MTSDELGVGGLRSSHRQRQRRFRGCLAALIALGVLVGAGAFAYIQGVDLLRDRLSGPEDYTGNGSGRVTVRVKDGDTSTDIGVTLFRRDVVASVEAFTDAARNEPRAKQIQAGYYTVKKRMSSKAALTLLLSPKSQTQNRVTIPEGLTVDETIERLVKATDIPQAKFAAALNRPDAIGLPGWSGGNPEGFLYPTTYSLPPKASAVKVLRLMTEQFKSEAASIDFAREAKKLGLSRYEALIASSIVQAEVSEKYMPKASRVLLNRVKEGQRFEMDSTGEFGYGGELADSTIMPESVKARAEAYDTYANDGWPPGPINSPGSAAIEATLDPAAGKWLYFVTTNLDTGETHFSNTFGQHSRWVREYRAFCGRSDKC